MIRILIMAGGKQSRLTVYDKPKCWLPIEEKYDELHVPETIIGRTQKQLKHLLGEREHEIRIVEPDPASKVRLGGVIADEIKKWGTKPALSALVFLGDVVWPLETLGTVLKDALSQTETVIYGRYEHKENPYTKKPYPEAFALYFCGGKTWDLEQSHHLWDLYKHRDTPLGELGPTWTDDIDTDEDYELRLPILKKLAYDDDNPQISKEQRQEVLDRYYAAQNGRIV